MTTESVFTGIRLPIDFRTKLDQIATSKRVSRNVVILWALDDYLAHFSLPTCPSSETVDNDKIRPADAAA